jgi:2-oxoacid:acceptor oxidoreductase gamma subunit (pyruvate/2-ketoisovalerate family)
MSQTEAGLMIELTLYGRGGQGGVTLAKLIATAFFLRGKWSQAFGVYAAERSGAPIQAYVRIDDDPIVNYNLIRRPDHILVLDPTLIAPNVAAGLASDGWVILNTPRPSEEWADVFRGHPVAAIDATAIAVNHGLGTAAVPIVNTTMLGAVARVFGLTLDEVSATLQELGFGGSNVIAATKAYYAVSKTPARDGAMPEIAPAAALPLLSILDPNAGMPPRIRTGSWATRRPDRRTLTPPCNNNCPAGNDVQRFIAATANFDYASALSVLLETTPLPGVCGRVCPAPCMDGCNRKELDEGVNVRDLERYVADAAAGSMTPSVPAHLRDEQVAVVGSGPAGLSAAYQLARSGYRVTILEAAPELGGVLRNGIPSYRLPKDVLDREIDFILDHGITVFTNEQVDAATLKRLSEKFSAVFLATGLQESRSLLSGERVVQGIDFLDAVHRGEITHPGEHVVVAGGGNTAIDAARTAHRLGAKDVRIVYRRTRAEMPAIAAEIDAAIEEGITLCELVQPMSLDRDVLLCAPVELGEPDASGRRTPVVNTSAEAQFALQCDQLILALGQSADRAILPDPVPANVFFGGDFATNDGTVTAAIGSGSRAAWQIHALLSGEDRPRRAVPRVATTADLHLNLFPHAQQQPPVVLPPWARQLTFAEVHRGYHNGDAAREAKRCLSCGVCNDCDRCIEHCPEGTLSRKGGEYKFDYDYCKGCGVCASECPRGVIQMTQL